MKIWSSIISGQQNLYPTKNKGLNEKSSLSNKINSKNFDNISISNNDAAVSQEDRFINDLKNKILSDIKATSDSSKINDIKSQIALGEYQINSDEIVRRMLLK